MNSNILPTDRQALLAKIKPDARGAGAVSSPWVPVNLVGYVLAVIAVGDMGTAATLDAKIEEAQDGSGTGAQDLEGKAIAQLDQAADGAESEAFINVRPDELSEGFTHVRLTLTIATESVDCYGALLGLDARYEPADQAASVSEVVG